VKSKVSEIETPQHKSLPARFILQLINFYQKAISPQTPARCRFSPTCSSYAKDAVSQHGAVKGTVLAVWRILRCNPFGKGGYDPVPGKSQCTCVLSKH
jgi:putative membrane protein insertion efficiency factor